MKVAAILALGLALGACHADNRSSDFTEYRLTDGRSVGSLVKSNEEALLLFYDPADCFACDQNLASILRDAGTRPVLVLLTRDPTPSERHMLRLYRIRAEGVLTSSEVHRRTPYAYLWSQGDFRSVALPDALSWLHS